MEGHIVPLIENPEYGEDVEDEENDDVENGIIFDIGEDVQNQRDGVEYDLRLTAEHLYLGTDLEELSGRVLLEDEAYVTMPLLSLPGVVLIPGQILPLQLTHPAIVAMMMNVIAKERTFGLLPPNHRIGTTVEIRSYSRNDNEYTILRIKAEGRQRFWLKEKWRQINGFLMGKVKILRDIDLTHPFKKNFSLVNNKGARYNRQLLPYVTTWPSFVYKLYDTHFIMNKINDQIHSWANIQTVPKEESTHPLENLIKDVRVSVISNLEGEEEERMQVQRTCVTTIRSDAASSESEDEEKSNSDVEDFSQTLLSPLKYSYWVAANLPLSDEQKITLLTTSSTIERLRMEYDLIQKCLHLCCAECKTKICSKDDIFSMSVEGPIQNFVNHVGYVHQTITVYKASNLRLVGRSSTEQSWFPGYSWTICQCSECGAHIGWKYMTVKGTRPEYFWGISRASIKPKMEISNDDIRNLNYRV